MRVLRERTSAVLVDVQERLFPHMHEKDILEKNLLVLLRGLEVLDIPLLATQQYTRGLGPTILPLRQTLGWTGKSSSGGPGGSAGPSAPAAGVPLHPTHGAPYIEKTAFSCWDEPRFPPALEALGRPCVLLAGIETHVCILQTAVDLKQAGFLPVVVEDCTSSRRERDRRIAVQRLQTEGILVSTCESILFELTREAGTELFKGISRLVK